MSQTEIVSTGTDVDADRVCHIEDRGSGISICGLVSVSVGRKYHGDGDWRDLRRYCQQNHQMCVVCLAEYERVRGRSYFECL